MARAAARRGGVSLAFSVAGKYISGLTNSLEPNVATRVGARLRRDL